MIKFEFILIIISYKMGIHHHTDFVCPGCDEYVGDNMKYCSECEGEYCSDCYNVEYKFFKKIKVDTNTNETIDNIIEDEDKDYNYYEQNDDYIECEEDDEEDDEDEKYEYIEVSYNILCNKCEERKNNYCECCCLYDTINSSKCNCAKYICDKCKTKKNNKTTCWLCLQNNKEFKQYLQKELNCSSMAEIIEKFNESK